MIIGLDVGGTHTDIVLVGREGLMREVKVPTKPSELFDTVLTGLEKIVEGVNPVEITRIVLSTTLSTNAIVQRKNDSVGMIVSSGPGIDPEFFRTNPLYFPVSGSIDHRGREVEPIDLSEIETVAETLLKENIRYVGVVGKFSVRNPSHELKIFDMLKGKFERVFVSHRISGNLNFPRRISNTYLNAAVFPIHKEFFNAVKQSLKEKGLTVPIFVLKADGGTMNFESSIDYPDQTILSGPAASVMGSIISAPEREDALVLDIGGTTTDMAILIDCVPLLDPVGTTIGDYKTLVRSLQTKSIGIGGDSVVTVVDNEIKIGPERKGPAMAYGGPVPTPTDALFAMKILDDGDVGKAVVGINSIAGQLNISMGEAAERIFDQACREILNQANEMIGQINSKPVYTVHEIKEGYKVNPKKILVLGGPAPYFAKRLDALSDFTSTVVPRWKVANAIGAALARTTCEVTLFADTESGFAVSPEENYHESVGKSFTKEDAKNKAFELLKSKALQIGAADGEIEMEIIEDLEFNMVRGFYTSGKNIRVKAQVKPGLIPGWETVAKALAEETKGD